MMAWAVPDDPVPVAFKLQVIQKQFPVGAAAAAADGHWGPGGPARVTVPGAPAAGGREPMARARPSLMIQPSFSATVPVTRIRAPTNKVGKSAPGPGPSGWQLYAFQVERNCAES